MAGMSDVDLTLPRFCGCRTGFVFVRRCGRPAVFQCGQCGLDLCEEHVQRSEEEPGRVFCPDCGPTLAGREYSSRSGAYHDGVDSGWVESDGDAFADEDYAAFDALSDFDVNADKGNAYDS